MKWKHVFRNVEPTPDLKEYAEEHLDKMSKFLLKDSQWTIHYEMGKVMFEVSVSVSNPDCHFQAKAAADSFYTAIDEAAHKLSKQFLKYKEQTQDHQNFERSKQGQLERVNSRLEYENAPYLPFGNKKIG